MAFKNIKDCKFGRLTAIECTGEKSKGGNFIWNFVCDCGARVTTPSGNVVSGHTKSCGCLVSDVITVEKTTHGFCAGHSRRKEYTCWAKAKDRCINSKNPNYKDYGAVGITMSEEFAKDFTAFVGHIGEMPKDGQKYSIDRIDNTQGYERGNIRWATAKQQARNKGAQTNNTSGFHGVSWDSKKWKYGIKLYAKAQWNNIVTGKLEAKRFSVDTYGLLPAFKLACEHRIAMIEQLNEQGAGYSPQHGK